ncbi:MAG TPA: hypothetical protein VGH20_01310 [Myxococcales bacterium]|jgi:hypothetical protein
MTTLERVGRAAGWLLAPVTGSLSLVRQARMFHPEGTVYRAAIEPLPGPYANVARRIEGPALARLSTALWRSGREWPDALGVALRIGREPGVEARRGDQDLLFATIRFPWTMPFSPLSTRQHDYLANDYFAVAPFEVEGVGRAKLRLRGHRPSGLRGHDRGAKLQEAIDRGEAVFRFELFVKGRWEPVAAVRLLKRIEVDQAALRFWPERTGRGFVPRGFVEAMRRGTYFLSQAARPSR